LFSISANFDDFTNLKVYLFPIISLLEIRVQKVESLDVSESNERHDVVTIQNKVMFGQYTVGKVQDPHWKPSTKIFVVAIVFWPYETEPIVVNVVCASFQIWVNCFGRRFDNVFSHVRVTNKHSSLRSESWVVLNGECFSCRFLNHEIDGVNTRDLGQLSKVKHPFLDLLVVNAEPIELRGCGNGVGIDLDVSILEDRGT